jgi:hypothetical protein
VYHCAACGRGFVHRYGITPDIFEAMAAAGIPHGCRGAAQKEEAPQV